MIDRHEIIKIIWSGENRLPVIFLISFVFLILSFPYRLAASLRNFLYDRSILRAKKLSCPVISIGNLTAGGTGKTPLAILLGGLLKENGFRPAILSRGYRRQLGKKPGVVSDGNRLLMNHREAGDEPFLMSLSIPRVPIIVGANRFLTGKKAIDELGTDVLILDDGFQHRALYRDIDIVLLEKSRPFGNGRLLPRGPLRETPQSLGRADIIVLTGNDGPAGLGLPDRLPPLGEVSAPVFQSSHKAVAIVDATRNTRPLAFMKGKRVYAFSGIGNPLSFRRTIEALEVMLAGFEAFPDHHYYKAAELAGIMANARAAQADLILTTEKDGVRLLDYPEYLEKICLLRIEMAFQPDRDSFLTLILEKLSEVNSDKQAIS